jgi:hypothetical protein
VGWSASLVAVLESRPQLVENGPNPAAVVQSLRVLRIEADHLVEFRDSAPVITVLCVNPATFEVGLRVFGVTLDRLVEISGMPE